MEQAGSALATWLSLSHPHPKASGSGAFLNLVTPPAALPEGLHGGPPVLHGAALLGRSGWVNPHSTEEQSGDLPEELAPS